MCVCVCKLYCLWLLVSKEVHLSYCYIGKGWVTKRVWEQYNKIFLQSKDTFTLD